MPLVNVKLIEGVFDDDQKREMIEKLTDTMVEIEGENMRGVTWVVIEEVKSGDWGIGGQALTTEAVHALAAGVRRRSHDRRGHRRARPPGARADARAASPTSAVSASPTRSSARASETILLLPPWAIVHSRFWKLQVPYLARHFRVVTFDPRGNGRSDRPESAEDYGPRMLAAQDALAVLDAAGAADASIVVPLRARAAPRCCSCVEHPERVRGAFFMSPALPHHAAAARAHRALLRRRAATPTRAGRRRTATTGRSDFRGYLEFFFEPLLPRAALDQADRGLGRLGARDDARDARAHDRGARPRPRRDRTTCSARVSLPAARHPGRRGPADPARPRRRVRRGSPAPSSSTLRGRRPLPARAPPGRASTTLLRDFADARLRPPGAAAAAGAARSARPRRALYVSSPIGLGHAWRDVAIARELRALHPDLEIDWLAQDPVTRVLEACGERIHPASALLANESRHIAAESREHELNVFQAWRRMDEILLANFMVFHDVVRDERLRPVDRRRGLGARLLPAREPGAEDARPTPS